MHAQADLFAVPPDPAVIDAIRVRLRAKLALVTAAARMPWPDMTTIVREDNAFRFSADLLPAAEGDALWAAFDIQMDRLYAVLRQEHAAAHP